MESTETADAGEVPSPPPSDEPQASAVAMPPRARGVVETAAGFLVLAAAAVVILRGRPGAGATAQPAAGAHEVAERLVLAGAERQRRGQVEAAEALYEQALRINPRATYAAYDMGVVALERGEPALAEFWFADALEADASHEAARTNLETARARAAQLPDQGLAALMVAALRARDLDANPELAAKMLEALVAKQPEHYGGRFQLARTLDVLGRRQEARAHWEAALALARQLGDTQFLGMIETRLAETP